MVDYSCTDGICISVSVHLVTRLSDIIWRINADRCSYTIVVIMWSNKTSKPFNLITRLPPCQVRFHIQVSWWGLQWWQPHRPAGSHTQSQKWARKTKVTCLEWFDIVWHGLTIWPCKISPLLQPKVKHGKTNWIGISTKMQAARRQINESKKPKPPVPGAIEATPTKNTSSSWKKVYNRRLSDLFWHCPMRTSWFDHIWSHCHLNASKRSSTLAITVQY